MYTLGEFHKNRNNGTVFEEMSEPIVDLNKTANTVLLFLNCSEEIWPYN